MLVIRTVAALRTWRKEQFQQIKRVGMVPTMGYLHQGHLSLVAEAKNRSERVLMSIFVNPLQFGPNEDLSRYPRDEARDLALAEAAGVDAVFLPDVLEMYPTQPSTTISVSGVSGGLCGASRPGHFDGVAFVVMKLFQLAQPDLACFGMKDAQQVAVIQQMVHDLAVPVEIIPCPIVREADGLAMSSRNVYLSVDERNQALVLSQALTRARHMAEMASKSIASLEPQLTIGEWIDTVRSVIETAPLASVDYIEVRTFPAWQIPERTMNVADACKQPLLLALAVRFGRTRLIDNLILHALEGRDNDV